MPSLQIFVLFVCINKPPFNRGVCVCVCAWNCGFAFAEVGKKGGWKGVRWVKKGWVKRGGQTLSYERNTKGLYPLPMKCCFWYIWFLNFSLFFVAFFAGVSKGKLHLKLQYIHRYPCVSSNSFQEKLIVITENIKRCCFWYASVIVFFVVGCIHLKILILKNMIIIQF